MTLIQRINRADVIPNSWPQISILCAPCVKWGHSMSFRVTPGAPQVSVSDFCVLLEHVAVYSRLRIDGPKNLCGFTLRRAADTSGRESSAKQLMIEGPYRTLWLIYVLRGFPCLLTQLLTYLLHGGDFLTWCDMQAFWQRYAKEPPPGWNVTCHEWAPHPKKSNNVSSQVHTSVIFFIGAFYRLVIWTAK